MTHPIPGADSERPLPPLPEPDGDWAGDEWFTADSMADYVRADRAAAKVGANVAADENLALVIARIEQIAGNFSETPRELAEEALVCARRIAAGAPASPDDLAFNAQRLRNVAYLVGLAGAIPDSDATLDGARGAVLGQIAARLRSEAKLDRFVAAGAPAETPKPDTCAEMRALCEYCGGTGDVHSITGEWHGRCTCDAAQPSPAPIAGDVEKDAGFLIRCDWEPCNPACASECNGHRDRCCNCDAALASMARQRAAMLANSSSGEAG